MCDTDNFDGEYSTVWEDRWYTARKDYKCNSCGVAVTPGKRYLRHFSVTDNHAYQEKLCLDCGVAYQDFSREHSVLTNSPAYIGQMLVDCIAEGGHESHERWGPVLEALRARDKASDERKAAERAHAAMLEIE